MRILYVARAGDHGNEDEAAITHAFRELGHEVERHPESQLLPLRVIADHDFVLFNKWHNVESLKTLEGLTRRIFWYWDRVDDPDPTLFRRSEQRKRWMADVMPCVDLGFCTDGDWAARHPDKLVWLPQGADGRKAGFGTPPAGGPDIDVLFFGSVVKCGTGRESFVREMNDRYGRRFVHAQGVYGRALADLIARAKVVVAPDAPVSDRYWSNRLYVALGYGAFLLHPYSEAVVSQFGGMALPYYFSRPDLHDRIVYYTGPLSGCRRGIAERGHRRTLEAHLYRHRCEELLRVVKERLP